MSRRINYPTSYPYVIPPDEERPCCSRPCCSTNLHHFYGAVRQYPTPKFQPSACKVYQDLRPLVTNCSSIIRPLPVQSTVCCYPSPNYMRLQVAEENVNLACSQQTPKYILTPGAGLNIKKSGVFPLHFRREPVCLCATHGSYSNPVWDKGLLTRSPKCMGIKCKSKGTKAEDEKESADAKQVRFEQDTSQPQARQCKCAGSHGTGAGSKCKCAGSHGTGAGSKCKCAGSHGAGAGSKCKCAGSHGAGAGSKRRSTERTVAGAGSKRNSAGRSGAGAGSKRKSAEHKAPGETRKTSSAESNAASKSTSAESSEAKSDQGSTSGSQKGGSSSDELNQRNIVV